MNLKSIIISTLIILGSVNNVSAAPKKIKEEIKVQGNCGACKERIENAAYDAGVISADWNSSTQTLKVIYNDKKLDHETIVQQVLSVGHDVEGELAPDEVYNNLPRCCQHRHVEPHDMHEIQIEMENDHEK